MRTDWRFTDYFYIYCLKNEAGDIFYVGKTYSLYARMMRHRRVFGKNFTYEVLDKTKSWDEAYEIEKRFISNFLSLGYKLVNKIGTTKKDHS